MVKWEYKMSKKIFISYSRVDSKNIANEIAQCLELKSIKNVFVDKDTLNNLDWDVQIEEAMTNYSSVLIILSMPKTRESKSCNPYFELSFGHILNSSRDKNIKSIMTQLMTSIRNTCLTPEKLIESIVINPKYSIMPILNYRDEDEFNIEQLETISDMIAHLIISDTRKQLRILGRTIQDKRKNLGLSRESLSEQLSLDYIDMLLLENGFWSRDDITEDIIQKLANILGMSELALSLLATVEDAELFDENEPIEDTLSDDHPMNNLENMFDILYRVAHPVCDIKNEDEEMSIRFSDDAIGSLG